jgi:hypothetical protein
VAALLKLLKTERSLKGRFLLINVLCNSRPQAKAAFVNGGALAVLEAWLNECKATHPRLLQLVLTALAELPVTLRALQAEGCGIGKVVSGLKKHVSEEVRRAAVTVIGQWKQLVDTTVHLTVTAAPPSAVPAVPAEATVAVSTAAQPHPPNADVGQLNVSSAPSLPNAAAPKAAAKLVTSSTSNPKPSAPAPSLLSLDDDNMFSGQVAPARSKLPTPRLSVGDGVRKPVPPRPDASSHSPAPPAAAATSPRPVSPMLVSSPKEPKMASGSTSPTTRSEAPPPAKQEATVSARDQAAVSGAPTVVAAKQGSGETATKVVANIEVTPEVTPASAVIPAHGSERTTPPPEPPVPPETLPTPPAVTAQVRTSSQAAEASSASVTEARQPASSRTASGAAALAAADVRPAPHILSEIITGELLASKGKADEMMDDPFRTHASEMVAAESEPPPFVKVRARTSALLSDLLSLTPEVASRIQRRSTYDTHKKEHVWRSTGSLLPPSPFEWPHSAPHTPRPGLLSLAENTLSPADEGGLVQRGGAGAGAILLSVRAHGGSRGGSQEPRRRQRARRLQPLGLARRGASR